MKQHDKTNKIHKLRSDLTNIKIKKFKMKQMNKTNKVHTLNQTIDCDMTDSKLRNSN